VNKKLFQFQLIAFDITNCFPLLPKHKQRMGQRASLPFTEEQLEDFVDCTFLSRKQILRVYELFKKYDADDDGTLEKDEFVKIPDFAANPFIERISEVFSQDGTGDIQFEDFLDFMSIFSSQVLEIFFFSSGFFSFFFPRNVVNPFFLSFFLQATPDVKVAYAFRIYGGPHLALIFLVEETKEKIILTRFSLCPCCQQTLTRTAIWESLTFSKPWSFLSAMK